MRPLKALVLVALFSLMMAGCGQPAAAPTATQQIEIAARVEPEPLAIGPATLIVTLRDASGSPVDGASLRVHADMDHEGMSPIDRETTGSSGGEYRLPVEWTMGGGWVVSVTARLSDGSEVSQSFDFFVEAVSSESIINQGRSTPVPAEADIQVAYQTESATVGDATVAITLSEPDGAPITDATVEVTGDMAHGGMMPISGAGTHSGSGRYTVPLTWTMAGDWVVTVQITLADGRQFEHTFDQVVVMP